MYAVITRPIFWGEIEQAIRSRNEEILFSQIGEDIDIDSEMDKIVRISVKYLIVDISSVNEEKVVDAIRKCRIRKGENTRIIIIAPNCLPGNLIISRLVNMGVYDIINPSGEENEMVILPSLLQVIEEKTPYWKAVKWDITSGEVPLTSQSQSQNKKIQDKRSTEKEKVIEKVTEKVVERTVTIEKERIIGTVVIAVAGTMKRIGTTHTALSIATYLQKQNFNVAVMELQDKKDFTAIKNAYVDVKDDGDSFILNSITFYPYNANLSILDVFQQEYNYIILDMGTYQECNIEEFKRANARIIVSGVKEWEVTELEIILFNSNDAIYKNKYLFTFADESSFKFIKSNMNELKCFKAPYNPDPFKIYKESNIYGELLRDVIPEVKRNTGRTKLFEMVKDVLKKQGEN